MPPRQIRFMRSILLASAALAGPIAAAAEDLPATPEGAKNIGAFVESLAGKAAAAPPALVVTPEGSDYLVTVDIGALAAPYKNAGFSYDSAILKFKVFAQDDGAWRVEQSEFAPLSGHAKQGDASFDFNSDLSGYKSTFVFDPKMAWVRSGEATGDKMAVHVHGPGLEEKIDAGALRATIASNATADSAVSTSVQESVSSFAVAVAVDPKAANPAANANARPVDFAMKGDGSTVGIKLDGFKPRTLFDLWAFLVAHPSRPDLAANEAALKTLLTAALAAQTSINEDIAVKKLSVQTAQGAFSFDSAKGGFAGAVAGPASRFEEHFAATGLTLPPGLVPSAYNDLVPTSFDFGFKVTGFDLTAAGSEAIADMHLAGDAPPISKEDGQKVGAKLLGAGPVVIDIPPSHIQAPLLDISFEGQIRYQGPKPTGTMTVHVRNFDKSVAALKALGPDAEKQMVPVVAMAKGMAKTDPDGVLTWVGELGADRVMKVNGLPLGKAPF